MALIEVRPQGGASFSVQVEGQSFAVTAAGTLVTDLGAPDAVTLVRASFEFLIEP